MYLTNGKFSRQHLIHVLFNQLHALTVSSRNYIRGNRGLGMRLQKEGCKFSRQHLIHVLFNQLHALTVSSRNYIRGDRDLGMRLQKEGRKSLPSGIHPGCGL